jgi:hypothetical protein
MEDGRLAHRAGRGRPASMDAARYGFGVGAVRRSTNIL